MGRLQSPDIGGTPCQQPAVFIIQTGGKSARFLFGTHLCLLASPRLREAVGEKQPGVGYEGHSLGTSKKVRTAVGHQIRPTDADHTSTSV